MEEYTIRLEGGVLWLDDLIFWDANVFRPSLEDALGYDEKIKAYVRFDMEYVMGKLEKYPKILLVGDSVFVNIR